MGAQCQGCASALGADSDGGSIFGLVSTVPFDDKPPGAAEDTEQELTEEEKAKIAHEQEVAEAAAKEAAEKEAAEKAEKERIAAEEAAAKAEQDAKDAEAAAVVAAEAKRVADEEAAAEAAAKKAAALVKRKTLQVGKDLRALKSTSVKTARTTLETEINCQKDIWDSMGLVKGKDYKEKMASLKEKMEIAMESGRDQPEDERASLEQVKSVAAEYQADINKSVSEKAQAVLDAIDLWPSIEALAEEVDLVAKLTPSEKPLEEKQAMIDACKLADIYGSHGPMGLLKARIVAVVIGEKKESESGAERVNSKEKKVAAPKPGSAAAKHRAKKAAEAAIHVGQM